MQKLRFFFILFFFPVALFAQRTKIYVDNWSSSKVDLKTNITYLKNPIFRQDNAILTCDSAVFYEKLNVFEAYKNVHINQADTMNIYSDNLTYNGNTKIAHLTNNVRMLDQASTLTTNILDYNMTSRIGTYIEGGKIINKDVTLTSKKGFYFANTRDAYFRYDVVVVTPQVLIKSDTMRYNTLTNWTYFYGPTNIKGKDDNLYTENGAYNTKTEYAYFGKKNLYTQGSKSLKGDSLYYDGKAGYGKAVRNIIFIDTEDKTLMRGQLGFYYKKDQRTLVTKNAYLGLGTSDSITVKDKKQPDSLWLGADTLETQMVLRQTLKLIPGPVILKDNQVGSEKPSVKPGAAKPKQGAVPPPGNSTKVLPRPDKKQKPKEDKKDKKPPAVQNKDSLVTDSSKISLKKDSLKKDILIKDTLKNVTLKKDSIPIKKEILSLKKDTLKSDSVKKNTAIKSVTTLLSNKKPLKDSIPLNPLDTVRARIIKAYHAVNVFKTNMQAKADSLFYTSADSTIRWYYNPIMWSQGTQQTGDTIYLQMRNKKLRSVQVLQKAFAVNVYSDSAKFNQVKGKKITGFFKDGKLQNMYVDGNAESIYFTKDDDGKAYKEMNQTVSSRIKINFKDGEILDVLTIREPEGAITPFSQLKEDVLLTGFIWKPELRPTSKLQIINPKARPKVNPKKAAPVKPKAIETTKPGTTETAKPGTIETDKPNTEEAPKSKTDIPAKPKATDSAKKPVSILQ